MVTSIFPYCRDKLAEAINGGEKCTSSRLLALQDTAICNTEPCPQGEEQFQRKYQTFYFSVDCKVGKWTSWSVCSVTCNGGTKRRTRSQNSTFLIPCRKKIADALNGGEACRNFHLIDKTNCNTASCPKGWLKMTILEIEFVLS